MTSRLPTSADVEEPERRALQADLLAPGLLRSLERAWQIFRYYRKRQLLARAWKVTAGRWLAAKALPVISQVHLREEARPALRQLLQLRSMRTEGEPTSLVPDLGAGTFTLLGERRALGRPVDWSGSAPRNAERLWRFQLQYQEYLLDAAAIGTEEAWCTIASLVDDWLKANLQAQVSTSDNAWHPYCISRRIPVWLMLLAQDRLPKKLRERMLVSLAAQVEWLRGNLESDLSGNHLLENAHALALAGCGLATATGSSTSLNEQWLTTAERILNQEMPMQLLVHGEHFERSPMYHVQVLGNLLQIALLTNGGRSRIARECWGWAERMWTFVETILHPDGEIPLFGDSCFGESYPIAQIRHLLEAVEIQQRGTVSATVAEVNEAVGSSPLIPYWVWRDDDSAWIVDGGAAAADPLPAHGHCDLGGFEASIDGVRWFVDGGVFGYSDDPMRHYCRSSLAHNVATIDNRNQFDIWSRFRLGYRATIERFQTHQEGDWSLAHSIHQAYRRLGVGPVHRLTIVHASGAWFCIDHIEKARGRSICGRLRLAPSVTTQPVSSASWLLADTKNVRVLHVFGDANSSFEHGWYAPRFGERHRIQVVAIESRAKQSAHFGWMLCRPDESDDFQIQLGSNSGTAVVKLVHTPSYRTLEWSLGRS